MEDWITKAAGVLAAAAAASLILGALLRSRALLVLGASIAISLLLTWMLHLMGLPIGFFFAFLGVGGLFGSRKRGERR